MGWEDRPYYRDRRSGPAGVLQWILNGSVSLGTWFGIHVKVISWFIIFIVWGLITREMGSWTDSLIYSALLFTIVLLHEFGHCFGSRMVGGHPTEILMHPFGGLASAGAPRRPWPNFITVLAGPMVNVIICLICLLVMGLVAHSWRGLPWSPRSLSPMILYKLSAANSGTFFFFFWVFSVSYSMLLFNLLPIYPLDGGQMLQSLLWVRFGYYKATYFASITGIVGGLIAAVLGIAWHNGPLTFIAFMGFSVSLNTYRELKANGPYAYEDEFDYGLGGPFGSGGGNTAVAKRSDARAARRAEKLQREAAREQREIDAILAKVSAQGMNSLTWMEKRALRKATERQRRRDAETTRGRRGR